MDTKALDLAFVNTYRMVDIPSKLYLHLGSKRKYIPKERYLQFEFASNANS
jgi:hypothetical protein